MNLTKTPPTLPINPEITRCNAHGSMEREWCVRRHNCAAYQTIVHDLPLWKAGHNIATANRKCWTENWVGYLPLDGFKDDDEVQE